MLMDTPLKERMKRKLETSGRITPREVLTAYEWTGLRPKSGNWGEVGVSACALAVLGYASGIEGHTGSYTGRRYEQERGISRDYTNGFIKGFDDNGHLRIRVGEERKGFRDGRRVRRFVFPSED